MELGGERRLPVPFPETNCFQLLREHWLATDSLATLQRSVSVVIHIHVYRWSQQATASLHVYPQ